MQSLARASASTWNVAAGSESSRTCPRYSRPMKARAQRWANHVRTRATGDHGYVSSLSAPRTHNTGALAARARAVSRSRTVRASVCLAGVEPAVSFTGRVASPIPPICMHLATSVQSHRGHRIKLDMCVTPLHADDSPRDESGMHWPMNKRDDFCAFHLVHMQKSGCIR